MAAFALQSIGPESYYIRLDSSIANQENDHALLLDVARQRTQSVTAVLYFADGLEMNALTARANLIARIKDVGVTLSEETTAWLGDLYYTVQCLPAEDPNFEKFPEVLQYQLRRLALVPLRGGKHLLGF
jgi:hypothetical protein